MRRFPAITLSLCMSNRQQYIFLASRITTFQFLKGKQSICFCTYSNTRNVSRSTCHAIYLLKAPQWLWSAGGALIRRRCSQLDISPDTSIIYTSRL
ncbi:hypothetical protein CDEST_11113 [Colletotrichum destructivum]|uniref:Uncharacterized protein n=1 Tax=Colletotrichum destructivum TaxID=34406 RepID=A0AAX4IS98_9PEZI|nr:hypothetical protein CDEST_11113 [Colletotrichum destructivum]